jgi:hypothetical protein
MDPQQLLHDNMLLYEKNQLLRQELLRTQQELFLTQQRLAEAYLLLSIAPSGQTEEDMMMELDIPQEKLDELSSLSKQYQDEQEDYPQRDDRSSYDSDSDDGW